jgi:hypothetical protein
LLKSTVMKLATLGIAVALGAAPVVAHAQVTVSGGISFNFGSLQGEPVADTDVFYDQLSPYGVWVSDPTVGQAFIPDEASFVPYTNGYWEDTDVGFVWVSNEPFAWATSHYGRWFFNNDYGRWAWMPDTTWGPNWVNWYETDGEFGWSPLAPDVIISAGYQPPIEAYRFVPSDRVLATNVSSYYVPRDRVTEIRRSARPVANRASVQGHSVITGPSPQRLKAHRVALNPKPLANTKALGRLDASQARTIEQRAKERRPQIEQQNAKRLEAKPELKRAVETKTQKTPTRPEQHTQPTRTEPQRTETTRPEPKVEPTRPEPQRAEPPRPEPKATRSEPRPEMTRPEPKAEPKASTNDKHQEQH